MAYQKNNNTTQRKYVLKTMPIVASGSAGKFTYNVDSFYALMNEFAGIDLFSKLTVNVTMARSLCLNDETAKGNMNVARIRSYDPEKGEMVLYFGGNSVQYANMVDGMVVVPRVRVAKDSDEVAGVTGFSIMRAMDA